MNEYRGVEGYKPPTRDTGSPNWGPRSSAGTGVRWLRVISMDHLIAAILAFLLKAHQLRPSMLRRDLISMFCGYHDPREPTTSGGMFPRVIYISTFRRYAAIHRRSEGVVWDSNIRHQFSFGKLELDDRSKWLFRCSPIYGEIKSLPGQKLVECRELLISDVITN